MSNKSNNFWYKASFLTLFFEFGDFAVNIFFEVCCGNFDTEKRKRRCPGNGALEKLSGKLFFFGGGLVDGGGGGRRHWRRVLWRRPRAAFRERGRYGGWAPVEGVDRNEVRAEGEASPLQLVVFPHYA
jgi:hypothetical protein